MKKTTFIYSFLGCFLTSAAVARSLYMDVGQNSQCDRYCLMNPNAGQCCPDSSVVSKLEISADGYGKIFEGLYFNGIKLFDYDGTPRDLSLTELLSIKNAASGIIPTLAKKQYNQGTQFVIIGDDGEWSEQSNPTRGEVYCDHVKFVLDANGGNGGLKNVYYKAGEGFYSDAARTNRIDTAGSTYHNNFTRSGYTLRGFFTSYLHWNTTTDTGSYINNLQPYRTIGHAVIRWNEDVHNTPGASAYLEFPSTSKVYPTRSCPDDNKTESSYPTSEDLHLYAGWAKQCVDTDRCTMTVSGPEIHKRCMMPANGKVGVCGRWLPGAVEYQLQGSCYGEVDGLTQSPAKDYTTPYVGPGLYFTLGTANLTCSGTQPPQNYTVDFQESWESFDGKTSNWTCDSVANTTCALNGDVTLPTTAPSCYRRNRTGSSNTSAQYVFNSWFNESYRFLNNNSGVKFRCTESGDYSAKPLSSNTFTGLRSFACLKNPSVSNGTVTLDPSRARYCRYTVTCNSGYHCKDNNCVVECRAFEDGTSYNSCDNFNSIDDVCVQNSPDLVDVTLDTRGGEMASGTSVKIARGGNLGAYVPDRTMYDGAIFVGWAKSDQPDSAANKNAVVDAAAGTSVTYRAVYTCPSSLSMNAKGTCVDESGDTEYVDADTGELRDPSQVSCFNPGSDHTCYWKNWITLKDAPLNFAFYSSPVQNSNEPLGEIYCDYSGTGLSGAGCWTDESKTQRLTQINVPTVSNYKFRGYFVNSDPALVTEVNDKAHAAFNKFYPLSTIASTIRLDNGHPVVVLKKNSDNYNGHLTLYGGWARDGTYLHIGSYYYGFDSHGLRKGNVEYFVTCNEGYHVVNNGAWNMACVGDSGTVSWNYKFTNGDTIVNVCQPTSAAPTSCDRGGHQYVQLATATQIECTGRNKVVEWKTPDGNTHALGDSVHCINAIFGDDDEATISGYVCDCDNLGTNTIVKCQSVCE